MPVTYTIKRNVPGKLKGWEFDDIDLAREEELNDTEVVLKALPKKLFIESDKPLRKEFPGLPKDWFPLTPVNGQWFLDTEENILISRKGYPIIPNFSTTIDGATGRTLTSSIADLGEFADKATHTRAMKGYIALSRVRCAGDLLIAQPFSPALFQRGPQPWPTLLLKNLRGQVEEHLLEDACKEAKQAANKSVLLKDLEWSCSRCIGAWDYTHFMSKGCTEETWFDEYARAIVKPGVLRACQLEVCTCPLCGLAKTEEKFTIGIWENRRKAERRTLCFECSHPKCTAPDCTTCVQCRNDTCSLEVGTCKEKSPILHWNDLPKTLAEVANFKCGKCMPRTLTCRTCGTDKLKQAFTETRWNRRFTQSAVCIACTPTDTHACHLCKIEKEQAAYTASSWHERLRKGREILCTDCLHPQCVAPACTTCTQCRNEKCKARAGNCKKEPTALEKKPKPKDLAEVQCFLCGRCKYISCSLCMSQAPKKQHTRLMRAQRAYVCGHCQDLQVSAQDRRNMGAAASSS